MRLYLPQWKKNPEPIPTPPGETDAPEDGEPQSQWVDQQTDE